MRVLITGSSNGIGRATTEKFLAEGHQVFGVDVDESHINHPEYEHYQCDVSDMDSIAFLSIPDPDILINNAGVQSGSLCRDIDVNLKGAMFMTECFGVRPSIKAIVNVASTSAHNGAEFPEYAASKGGLLAYTKNVALRVAKYGATCNSISPGGVLTDMNYHITHNPELWDQVMAESLIKKWATAEEIADWIYFIAVINKSMTAQDIIIDNGEMANANFVW